MKTTHNRKAAKIISAFAQERSIRDLGQEKKVLEQRINKANEFIQKTQQMFYMQDVHFIMNNNGLPMTISRYAIDRASLPIIKF